MASDIETKMSTFNEAGFQMTRLHELQRSMNQFRVSPFSNLHSDLQYDFELWAACIDGLYLELSPKLKPTEDKEVMLLLSGVRNAMSTLLRVKDTSLWGIQTHRKKMSKIREALFTAEKKIRRLLDDHGLGSPNAEDNSGDPYA